jgi:hypothetical protein
MELVFFGNLTTGETVFWAVMQSNPAGVHGATTTNILVII